MKEAVSKMRQSLKQLLKASLMMKIAILNFKFGVQDSQLIIQGFVNFYTFFFGLVHCTNEVRIHCTEVRICSLQLRK